MAGDSLSKSRFLSGWQCHKRLWLETHDPGKAESSPGAERAFSVGHQVGAIARRLFPGGILIPHEDSLADAIEETRSRLATPGPITLFEATFRHQGVLVRTDVLVRDELDRIRLIEVKASTRVKPVNYMDCAVQAWVLSGEGIHPTTVELAHIDTGFVYQGNEDYRGLLTTVDLTDRVGAMLEQIPAWLGQFRQVLAADIPAIRTGPQCRNPYECPFISFCRSALPAYPLDVLPGGGKILWELADEGVKDIRDIPEDRLTSQIQRRVRRVTIAGRPELDPAAAKQLAGLAWPRFYLDFETVSPAVPVWSGTRPYQVIPFQWSCHVQAAEGLLSHREWLAGTVGPPMRECAETVIEAVQGAGPILTYSGYEKRVLEGLAALFPDLSAALSQIIDRLIDLHAVTKACYYHPDMRGSWSIKAVLPTVAPDMNYGSLGSVQEGAGASEAFLEIIDPDTTEARRLELRQDLLQYCAFDTLALVRLAEFLQGKT